MNAKHHLFEKVLAYLLRSKRLLSSAQEKATVTPAACCISKADKAIKKNIIFLLFYY